MNINLFVNLYHHGHDARDEELKFAFMQNQVRGHFSEIVHVNGRPTFNDFFAATREDGADINVIANADIFFDGSLGLVKDYYKRGGRAVMALSRWDMTDARTENAIIHAHKDSQDAWIFFGPVPHIEGADFEMGRPGCDNRIARVLEDAGYHLINPAWTIKAYHVHMSGERKYGKGRGRAKVGVVPGPYSFVEVAELIRP